MNKPSELGIWVALTALGGTLYRMGGAAGYNTKFRDCGVSACICALIIALGRVSGLWQWLSLLGVFGLTWAALTTYRYFLPKPANYRWWYYSMHGFFVALAALPYAWASGHWLGFAIRCAICAAFVGAWSGFMKWDVGEEFGRGVILTGTVFFL